MDIEMLNLMTVALTQVSLSGMIFGTVIVVLSFFNRSFTALTIGYIVTLLSTAALYPFAQNSQLTEPWLIDGLNFGAMIILNAVYAARCHELYEQHKATQSSEAVTTDAAG